MTTLLEESLYKKDLGYRVRFEKVEREIFYIPGIVGPDAATEKYASFKNFILGWNKEVDERFEEATK